MARATAPILFGLRARTSTTTTRSNSSPRIILDSRRAKEKRPAKTSAGRSVFQSYYFS
jgi:hypothetical protein